MRAEALAKKVQTEKDKECTFKPKKISKTRKTSPKKGSGTGSGGGSKDWEPKSRTDSPKKKSSQTYDKEEDMPAHERLFKKANDASAKRRYGGHL